MVRGRKPVHTENRVFNGTWSLLHLVAALQCVMILAHIGSSRYHWLRATREDDPA